jgi:hypothetical protein
MPPAPYQHQEGVVYGWIALTVVAAVAYKRVRNQRVLMVTLAFALFAVKGVILTLSLLWEDVSDTYLAIAVLMDTIIIVLLAMTVLKK